jgi:tRNA (cytidine/uridine-2'-O-)-methyltransferase
LLDWIWATIFKNSLLDIQIIDMQSDLNVVLFQPEIPQNTGNIGRLCAFANVRLHLIHPLGFQLSDRYLKRSGMDYWESLDLREHISWEAFLANEPEFKSKGWLFTTRAVQPHWARPYKKGDFLLFGSESHGCPEFVHSCVDDTRRLKIPQFADDQRSLNLATSVGIGAYEALKSVKEFVKNADNQT